MPKKCVFCGRDEQPDDWMKYYQIAGKDICHQCIMDNLTDLMKVVSQAMAEDKKGRER